MAEKKKSEILSGILDPSFGKSQEEKAKKKREELYKSMGEAYETGKDYLSQGVDYVSDFFTPSKEKKQNTIDYLRKMGNVERANKMQEQLDKESEPVSEDISTAVEDEAVEPVETEPTETEPVKTEPVETEPTETDEPAKDEAPPTDEEPEDPTMKQTEEGVQALRQVDLGDMTELALQDNQIREEYLNELAEAKEMYARTKDEIAQKKIWEALLNGIGALATAWYGRNTGLDLSGVKFSPSDWDSKLDQARQDLAVAKSFAKDVRDVKLEGTEAERTRMIREMQGDKAFNEAVFDKLRYDIYMDQKNAKDAAALSDEAAQKQQALLPQVKNELPFSRYTDEKKKLEKVMEDYKKEPSDELLEQIKYHSEIMQRNADQLSDKIGVTFPNEYPPSIFEEIKRPGFFGLFKSSRPEYKEILEKRSASLETIMSPEDLAIYKKMLNTPSSTDEIAEQKKRAAQHLYERYPQLFEGGQ